MKAALMAVGFLLLATSLFFEMWPPAERYEGWVCQGANEDQQQHRDIVYGCSTTFWDYFASTSTSELALEKDKNRLRPPDGTTLAVVGLGFLVASLAVGQTQARAGQSAPPANSGPNPMGPPAMAGHQAPPAPSAPGPSGGPPGPPARPGPPPGFGR